MGYNKEYSKKYNKEYYNKNKEKIDAKAKKWQKANPEKVKASKQKWANANRQKIQTISQNWKSTLRGCLTTKLGHLKKSKRNKIIQITITIDDLLSLWEKQDGKCAISKYPMRHILSSLFGVSIDRIDSTKDYTPDNIQLVCQAINFGKNMYKNEEMIEFWEYRNNLN